MSNYNVLTPIELLKLINDTKNEHDNIKSEILSILKIIEEKENLVNEKLNILKTIEDKYVLLIEEYNKKI